MTVFGANPVDIVVLIVILTSALLALVRGFVAEVLAILGWVAAFFAALYGMKPILPFVERYTGPGPTAAAVAVGVLFLGTLLVMSALSYAVSRAMRTHHLSAVDRSLGFLFGLARGGLLVCLLYICVTFVFPLPKEGEPVEPNTMQAVLLDARTQPALASASSALIALAPNRPLSVEDLTRSPLSSLLDPAGTPPKGSSGTAGSTPSPSSSSGDTTQTSGYAPAARAGLARMLDRIGADAPDTPVAPPADDSLSADPAPSSRN